MSVDLMVPPDSRKFQVRCDGGRQGRFEVGTDTLSVRIGTTDASRKRAGNVGFRQHPMQRAAGWVLTVEVIVSHPDWEEAKTIAAIHSRPQDCGAGTPSLRCELQLSGSSCGLQGTSGAQ